MATHTQAQQGIDVQIARLEQELLELKRQRNDLSPISAIPPEILCEILLLATISPHVPEEPLKLPNIRVERYIGILCHVSHSWRITALGCPQLWAGIDVRRATDRRQVGFMLDHAAPLPLSLHVDAQAPDGQRRQLSALDPVVKVLSEGVPFDKLGLSGSLNLLTELLRNARPTGLRALRIIVSDGQSLGYTAAGASIAQHTLFTQGAPELRALTVEGCAIPLTSPILLQPKLTSLGIYIQRESAAQVLGILKAMRQIQRVYLDFRGPLSSSTAALGPVHLPYLSTILLSGQSDVILTTVSNLRLSSTTVELNLACSFRNQSLMPAYGAKLFKAIGQARWTHERAHNVVAPDDPFSPETLDLGNKPYDVQILNNTCCLRTSNLTPNISVDRVSVFFIDQSTSSYTNWSEWHPLALAKHPRDLRLTTGWSMDRLELVRFISYDAKYPELFWGLLSDCPRILELEIAPVQLPKLIPLLSADKGGLPFPSLRSIVVQRHDVASTTAGENYESLLESLLVTLRKRRNLCKKYGISKSWMLDQLSLDDCVSGPSQLLLDTAHAEGLIGLYR